MRLSIGQRAPDFATLDIMHQPFELYGFSAGRKVLLHFFRHPESSFSRHFKQSVLQFHFMLQKFGIYQVAIFPSTEETIFRFGDEESFTFPILADPNKRIFDLYGIEESFWGLWKGICSPNWIWKSFVDGIYPSLSLRDILTQPASFLINQNREIEYIHYSPSPWSFMDIKSFLIHHKKREVTPRHLSPSQRDIISPIKS